MNDMTEVNNLVVVKIGGAAGIDLERCADDIARLGRPLVLVHGVSALMDALCIERGVPVRTLISPSGHSSRYTDPQTRDVYVEACERMNAQLVSLLRARGAHARGLIGEDIPLWGERKRALRTVINGRMCIVRDDHSGAITQVENAPIFDALQAGAIAVVPPMAKSADGLLNVDGDRAGAAIAGSLFATEYVIMSGVRGLYRQFPDEASFVPQVLHGDVESALAWAEGRMKRKVIGAAEALAAGVPRVIIGDGRAHAPISAALGGAGTEFRA